MWGTNSRRTILKAAAALGTVGTVGIGTAQAAEHGDEPEDGGPDVTGEIAASADDVFWLLLDQEGLHVEDPWRAVITEDGDAGDADDGAPDDGTPDEGEPAGDADEGEPAADAQDDQPTGTNPTLELEEGGVYVLSWYNDLDSEKVEIEGADGAGDDADGADDDDGEVDVEAEDDEDDEDDEAEDARLRKGASVLTLLDENDEEVVRSDGVISGESGAIVFTATTDLATYREELTEAEGDIQVGDAAEAADDAAEEDDEVAADDDDEAGADEGEDDEAAADEGEDEAEAEA